MMPQPRSLEPPLLYVNDDFSFTQEKADAEADKIRIIFSGKVLKPDTPLAEYGMLFRPASLTQMSRMVAASTSSLVGSPRLRLPPHPLLPPSPPRPLLLLPLLLLPPLPSPLSPNPPNRPSRLSASRSSPTWAWA